MTCIDRPTAREQRKGRDPCVTELPDGIRDARAAAPETTMPGT
ncbi:hypothetical protein [Agromyces laixinhei]|nr:hypothetical protein [Agromyces laixinhei]